MRRFALLTIVTSCVSAPPPAATSTSEPLPAVPGPPSEPPPEVPALDLPDLKAAFDPATFATGRAPGLRAALEGKEKVALLWSPAFSGADDEKRVFDMLKAIQPKAKVLVRGRDAMRGLQAERGERPEEVRPEATGQTDIFGRPTYVFKDVMLQTEWLGKAKKMYGADVMIWIDVAKLDPERSRRFRELVVGGCAPLLAEIDAMRAKADAALAPFADHVNRMLLARFQERVRPQANAWLAALAAWSDPPRDRLSYDREEQFTTHQCGHAFHRIVSDAARCQTPGCAEVPSLRTTDGAWIGVSPSAVYFAPDCRDRIGTDYVEKLRDAAAAAAGDVAAKLPAESGARVAAAGTLTSLRNAVAGACAPARGRLPEDQRAAAAATIHTTIAALREARLGAGDGWIEERVQRALPGGRALQAARFRSAAVESAERDIVDIGREAKARQCRSTRDDPIAVGAVDVGTSETLYFDYFREEEIFCEGMAPVGLTP